MPGPVLILPGRAVGADGAFNELNPRHITSCRPNGPTPKVAGRCWVPLNAYWNGGASPLRLSNSSARISAYAVPPGVPRRRR